MGQEAKFDIEGAVGINSRRDLVLLKISASSTTPLPLGNSEAVEVGEPVYAVGNPQGLEGTFSQGIVSSIRQVGHDKLLQITAPISPGSSSGPVLNSKGEVVGVAVATFEGGQNLNLAIPSNYLKELSENLQTLAPLARVKPSTKQQSILSGLGGRSTEGGVGERLTWAFPRVAVGSYAFSLRNKLRKDVKEVYCLVVFYDNRGEPIDIDIVQYRGVIPAGLAKRVASGVDGSVQQLQRRVEFRILDFRITE